MMKAWLCFVIFLLFLGGRTIGASSTCVLSSFCTSFRTSFFVMVCILKVRIEYQHQESNINTNTNLEERLLCLSASMLVGLWLFVDPYVIESVLFIAIISNYLDVNGCYCSCHCCMFFKR